MKQITTILNKMPSRTLFNTATLLLGGLICSAAIAFADNDTSTQTVLGSDLIMPYDGYLMIDSAPITGTRTIKFDLYDAAGGGNIVWSETQTVSLYNGRFSVGLGSSTSLTNTILDAEKIWLSMTVVETDANGNSVEIALAGRQAIEPAPFAAWSGNSADLNVGGDLNVAGDAIIAGDRLSLGSGDALTESGSNQLQISPGKAHAGGVIVDNDFSTNHNTFLGNGYTADHTYIRGLDNDGTDAALTIQSASNQIMLLDGNEIDSTQGPLFLQNNSAEDTRLMSDFYLDGMIKFAYSNWDGTDVGDGGAAIANDNNTYQALMLVGNDAATGNDRQIRMYDDVTINKLLTVPDATITDDLSVTDDVGVGGNVTVTGGVYYTPDCPGSPAKEVVNASKRARMCVYTVGGGSNSDQAGIANRCWDNHGAQLCTVAQMHIAVDNGLSLTTNYWLADRTNDDEAVLTNRTGTTFNFDDVKDPTSNFNGGYCCIVLHGQ